MKKKVANTITLYKGIIKLEQDLATETLIVRLPALARRTRPHRCFLIILTHLHAYGFKKLLLDFTSSAGATAKKNDKAFEEYVQQLTETPVQKVASIGAQQKELQNDVKMPGLEFRAFDTEVEALLWLMTL